MTSRCSANPEANGTEWARGGRALSTPASYASLRWCWMAASSSVSDQITSPPVIFATGDLSTVKMHGYF